MDEESKKVKLFQSRLKVAQSRQKSYANRRQGKLEFEIGDWVFLKLTPKRGIERHPQEGKLSPRYIGPFEVTERIGSLAYQLDLSDGLTRIHTCSISHS